MIKLIQKFTKEKLIDLNKVVKLGREFYLVDPKLRTVHKKINKQAAYIGTFLGQNEKPSLYLLDLLAKHSKKKVIVTKKGEWLFICKRDLFAKGIKDTEGNPQINDFVLIMNQDNECLGYGQMIAELSARKTVIKRIFDIGDFLRRE
jgi:ribosome biogenesis protein Nip4